MARLFEIASSVEQQSPDQVHDLADLPQILLWFCGTP
jgi:hypothetical protein